MNSFEEGFDFYCKNADSNITQALNIAYVKNVQKQIESLLAELEEFTGYGTNVKQLKGNIAEIFKAGTFNIDAARNGSIHRANVLKSTDFASVDVSTNFGKDYSLKYCADGVKSAKAQAQSIFERFVDYRSKHQDITIDEYLCDRGYSNDVVLSDPIYSGQIRLIPDDQYQEAIIWLKQKIIKEETIRSDQVKRYKETLACLETAVRDNQGNKSWKLTESDSRKLAAQAKEGNIDIEEWGLTLDQAIEIKQVLKQAFKSGLTAAVLDAVIKSAPHIYNAIIYLIKNGELDEDEFKKAGIEAAKGGAEGFIVGSVTGALTDILLKNALSSGAKSGLSSVTPSLVSAFVVFGMNIIKDSIKVARGKMTRYELTNNIIRNVYVTSLATASGAVAEYFLKIPVAAYMLGSLVGSILGSVTYSLASKVTIALCVETGFTLFGLVDQDYTLSEDIIKEIGIEVFSYEKFMPSEFTYDEFKPDLFLADEFIPEKIELICLRRGVIGVGKIAYI